MYENEEMSLPCAFLECAMSLHFTLLMHLMQLVFTYSACGLFTKKKKRIEQLKSLCKLEILNFIYKNKLDKACFQHGLWRNKRFSKNNSIR